MSKLRVNILVTKEMIIDAKDMIAGRIATIAAKTAILGEDVVIINSELAVITGTKKRTLEKYQAQENRGEPFHGPFLPKTPDRFLKRLIRGMLTYKKGKGRDAFKRITCYRGVPEAFKGKEITRIEKAHVSRIQHLKYVTINEICQYIKQQ